MNNLCKCVLLGFALALNGCTGHFEFGIEQFERVSGPEDAIPFEALGSGKLAFIREHTLFIIDVDTKSTWGIKGPTQEGVISPDGKNVVLRRTGSSEGPGEIVVYYSSTDTFTKIPGSEHSINPSWTADSQYLLCVAYGPTGIALVRQSLTGVHVSTVTTFPNPGPYGGFVVTSMVSTSENDDLTFTLNKSTPDSIKSGIFTINLNGSGLTQIVSDTSRTAHAYSPCWSPNGEQVAYIHSQVDENFLIAQTKVVVMNSDGSNVSTLATFPAVARYPTYNGTDQDPSITWSPDGTRLAFNMWETDGVHIYVMNADGSGLTKVTSAAEKKDGYLSWSR